jgi:ketosteroid isomerase-like protein
VKDAASVIAQAYAAFNGRDIEGALELMNEDVSWPKASEGGRATGKQQIRDYWVRQWAEFDPHVAPLAMSTDDAGRTRVRVHQVIRSLAGACLWDGEVVHVFTMRNGLILAMDLGDPGERNSGPSLAFTSHS